MTSFILSLWRWLLSWLRRQTGSNTVLRTIWEIFQRLPRAPARQHANGSPGDCRPLPSKGSTRFVRFFDPPEHFGQSGYTVISASHDFVRSDSFLSTAPSTSLGYQDSLQVIDENAVPRNRPASPIPGSSTYFSAVVQEEPSEGPHSSLTHLPKQRAPSTVYQLPDARKSRLNIQTSHASLRTQTSTRVHARKSSVAVHVVPPDGFPAASVTSLARPLSRMSDASRGSHLSSNDSTHSIFPGLGHPGSIYQSSQHSHSSIRTTTTDNQAEDVANPPTPTQTDVVVPQGIDPLPGAQPVSAGHFLNSRYAERPMIHKSNQNDLIIIPKLMFNFEPEDLVNIDRWTSHIHPEGTRFYYHSDYHFYTDCDMMDLMWSNKAANFTEQLHIAIRAICPKELLPHIEAAFFIRLNHEDTNGVEWYAEYYLVNHRSKTLFWLHDFDAVTNGFASELYGNSQAWHFGNEIEAQYWTHWELFPSRPIEPAAVHELLRILVHSGHDLIMSRKSSAPFNLDETQQMITFIKQLRDQDLIASAHTTNVVARTLATYAHEKALNYAGLPFARLSRDQRVFVDLQHVQTPLITCISPLLFYAPHVHLKVLEKLYIDDMINQTPWKSFIEHVKEDWRDLTIMATVLLAVNTAMLAIPSVDDGWSASRSATQILSYLSTLSSIASILTSLMLIRQYRPMALNTAAEAVDHIARHQKQSIGLETMAIMHSLPYASLMWSMTTFLGSFSTLVLDNTHAPTHWIYGTALVLVAILTLWCIYDTWDKKQWYSRLLNGSLARKGWAHAMKHLPTVGPGSSDSSSSSSVDSTSKNTATPAGLGTELKHKTPKKKWWQWWWTQPVLSESLPMHTMPPTPLGPTRPATPQSTASRTNAADGNEEIG